jgi:hypothetical protein
MAENKARASNDNGFEPPYTTLHVGVVQGGTAVNITAELRSFAMRSVSFPAMRASIMSGATRPGSPSSKRR